MIPPDTTDTGGLSRRSFLKTSTAAGAALAWGSVAPAFGINPGPAQVKVALLGVGAQGQVLMEAALRIPYVRFVAVCDIWDYRRTYGERYLKKSGHDVRAYTDVEDMLAKEKDLDAVLVATPDFWHAPHSIACMKAGKHVYCEKMMSNTIEGARSMVKAMRETGKLLQIGHQRRSNPRYLFALNRLIREAGITGRITAANAQWNRAVTKDLGWPKNATIPPAVLARYGFSDMHTFRNWRWFRRYGGGPLSDLGAHQIDIFNWFFGGPPKTIMASGGVDYYQNHEWYDQAMVIYEYATPAGPARAFYQVLTTTSSGGGYWESFMGIDGTLKISENPSYSAVFREAHAPSWENWVRRNYLAQTKAPAVAESEARKVDARETAALVAYKIPVVFNKAIHQPHLENFFLAVQGKGTLNCPADEALASEMAVYKASEAVAAQRMITLDPAECHV
jgi:predicted dehydrogenase